jgi:hypothetical protein
MQTQKRQSRRIISSPQPDEFASQDGTQIEDALQKEFAVRIFLASIVIGPLMLFGALSAAAGQLISSDMPIQLAASSDSTIDRDTYAQKARDDLHEWQQKLHDFGEKAKAKGQEEGNKTRNELNAAWTKADAEQRKLQSASAEGWDSAKSSFERASHDLKDVWDKIRPDDK